MRERPSIHGVVTDLAEEFGGGFLGPGIIARNRQRAAVWRASRARIGHDILNGDGIERLDHARLRLAALAPCCGVRDMVTRALRGAGIEWNEVFIGGGHAAVMAAISAGLAVAAFSCRLALPDTLEVGQRLGLPDLPSSRIMLHSTLTDPRSRAALRTLAAVYREHRSPRQASTPD